MARKVITHKITADGRDKGKSFVITEMSAVQAHKWATKALFAVLNSGVEMPDELASLGLAGLASMGMGAISSIPFAVADPLLDELMTCVQVEVGSTTRKLFEDDIEEVSTIFELQGKTLQMHLAPFITAASQASPSAQMTPAPGG